MGGGYWNMHMMMRIFFAWFISIGLVNKYKKELETWTAGIVRSFTVRTSNEKIDPKVAQRLHNRWFEQNESKSSDTSSITRIAQDSMKYKKHTEHLYTFELHVCFDDLILLEFFVLFWLFYTHWSLDFLFTFHFYYWKCLTSLKRATVVEQHCSRYII